MKGSRQLGLLWAATALAVVALSPFGDLLTGTIGAAGFSACPMKTLAGIPCPTCGTTRAAFLLADFRFVEALLRFPLPTLGWIAFLGGGLAAGAWVLAGRDLPSPPRRLPPWIAVGIVAAVLANWAYAIATGV